MFLLNTTNSNRTIIILTFLFLAGSVMAQESQESSLSDEMEDSLSSLAVTPIEKPKELLKQIFERLEIDLQQKHEARKYLSKAYFEYDVIPPFTASVILPIEGDNGIEVLGQMWKLAGIELEDFNVSLKEKLTKSSIARIKDHLLWELEGCVHSCTHKSYASKKGWGHKPWLVGYKDAVKRFAIEAYRITDDSGRGVFRIIFLEKRKDKVFNKRIYINITAYFDINTLRLTRLYADYLNDPWRFRQLYDYEDRNGFPLLRQLKANEQYTGLLVKKTIKLMDK